MDDISAQHQVLAIVEGQLVSILHIEGTGDDGVGSRLHTTLRWVSLLLARIVDRPALVRALRVLVEGVGVLVAVEGEVRGGKAVPLPIVPLGHKLVVPRDGDQGSGVLVDVADSHVGGT